MHIEETPREQCFCAHAMMGNEPMVVRDATRDPQFLANPLVAGNPDIRFYAGIPLRSADGSPLGALCAIDTRPRDIKWRQLAVLGDLAKLTMEQLELRRMATLDGLTGAIRREPFMASAAREMEMARRRRSALSCLMIDIDNFKSLNDRFGHAFGDAVLITVAAGIRDQLRRSDSLGRLGGEEFWVFVPGTDREAAIVVADRMRQAIQAMSFSANTGEVRITISIGAAQMSYPDAAPSELIQRADIALYTAKNSGRNRVAA